MGHRRPAFDFVGFAAVLAISALACVGPPAGTSPHPRPASDSAHLAAESDSTEAYLLGYRKLPLKFFHLKGVVLSGPVPELPVGIPVAGLVESVEVLPAIKKVIAAEGKTPSQLRPSEWAKITKSLADVSNMDRVPASVKLTSASTGTISVDPVLVAYLPNTELAKQRGSVSFSTVVGSTKADWLAVDPVAFMAFTQAYQAIEWDSGVPATEAWKKVRYADLRLSALPNLKRVAQVPVARITFGQPLVAFSSPQRDLLVPPNFLIDHNVYYVSFAFSVRNIDPRMLEKLSFLVELTDGRAIDLIPLHYAKSAAVTRIVASPELRIRVGSIEVSIGEFFKSREEYKILRPTVVAHGLQEASFSWTLQEEAIFVEKRFVAVLQIPRARESLPVQLSAFAQSKSFNWAVQGDILFSEPEIREIRLH